MHLLHLSHRLRDLVEADVEVELLLFQGRPLLPIQFDKVVDEVQEVPGSDGHGPAPPLEGALVGLVEGLVDVDHGVDDGVAVVGRHVGLVGHRHREKVGGAPRGPLQIDLDGELATNLEQGVIRPVTEPVEDTPILERGILFNSGFIFVQNCIYFCKQRKDICVIF